jgi:hypothetical protein
MCEAGIIYVSNGSTGDCIMENVAFQCKRQGYYDQYTIAKQIMLDPNTDTIGHAKYWAEEAKKRGYRK